MHYVSCGLRLYNCFASFFCQCRRWFRIASVRDRPGVTMVQPSALLMRFPIPSLALLISFLFTQAPSQNAPAKTPSLHFEDVARQAGLTVAHRSSREQHYIIESMSG